VGPMRTYSTDVEREEERCWAVHWCVGSFSSPRRISRLEDRILQSISLRISYSTESPNLLGIIEHVLRSVPGVSSDRAVDSCTSRVLMAAYCVDHDSVEKLIEQLA
jgi:hypothetical protein